MISDQAVYGVGSDGGELWNYPLENTVDQAALGNKEYIVLALGDGVANKDGREKGTVCWLDGSGNEKAPLPPAKCDVSACGRKRHCGRQ